MNFNYDLIWFVKIFQLPSIFILHMKFDIVNPYKLLYLPLYINSMGINRGINEWREETNFMSKLNIK